MENHVFASLWWTFPKTADDIKMTGCANYWEIIGVTDVSVKGAETVSTVLQLICNFRRNILYVCLKWADIIYDMEECVKAWPCVLTSVKGVEEKDHTIKRKQCIFNIELLNWNCKKHFHWHRCFCSYSFCYQISPVLMAIPYNPWGTKKLYFDCLKVNQ